VDDIDNLNAPAHTLAQVNKENEAKGEMMTADDETSLHAQRERDPVGFAREIESYRAALREYLDFNSLRQAAREVGLSPTGLSNFVNGAEPYVPTIRKLRAWMASRPRRRGDDG
jgi:hypothetical protein